MRSISILPLLFFGLSWAQLLGASVNLLSIPIALTILPDTTAIPPPTSTDPTTIIPQQTSDQSVVVTSVVQTTVLPDSSTVVVTHPISYAVLPTITKGATTLTINSKTYTISVDPEDGATSINGGNDGNGTAAGLSASVIGDKTVIIDTPQTTTIFGTSILTTTADGPTGIATNGGSDIKMHKTNQLGVGIGVGIGVGLMVLLIVTGLFVAFCFRKRRIQQRLEHKIELMSAASAEAAAFADDRSSTKTRSENGRMEKLELDSTSVHIVQRDPVELMGDLPQVLEMSGSGPEDRSSSEGTARPTDRQNSTRRTRDSFSNELETWLEEETSGLGEPPSPLVSSFSRRATQSSSMVSPIERSNSEREGQWPPLPARVNERTV